MLHRTAFLRYLPFCRKLVTKRRSTFAQAVSNDLLPSLVVIFPDWQPESLADLVDLLHTGQTTAATVGSTVARDRAAGLQHLLHALGIQLTGLEVGEAEYRPVASTTTENLSSSAGLPEEREDVTVESPQSSPVGELNDEATKASCDTRVEIRTEAFESEKYFGTAVVAKNRTKRSWGTMGEDVVEESAVPKDPAQKKQTRRSFGTASAEDTVESAAVLVGTSTALQKKPTRRSFGTASAEDTAEPAAVPKDTGTALQKKPARRKITEQSNVNYQGGMDADYFMLDKA